MGVYNRGKYLFATGALPWLTADIRWLLTNASYTPATSHNFVSDVTNEIVATGYVRQSQGTESADEDDANDRVELSHADVTFAISQSGVAYRYAVRFKFVSVDGDSPLIDWFDLGAQSTNGTNVVLRAGTDGSLQVL